MPTCKAMGGAHRKSVALYNGIGGTEPEEVADQAEWSVSKGYKFVKMHLKETLEKDIEIARKVRERVGDSIGIMIDVHMGFDTFNVSAFSCLAIKHVPAWNQYVRGGQLYECCMYWGNIFRV